MARTDGKPTFAEAIVNGEVAPISGRSHNGSRAKQFDQSRRSPRGRHRPPIRAIWVGRLPFLLPYAFIVRMFFF
jgi:hypothetical protein